jgi:hypothetical protein
MKTYGGSRCIAPRFLDYCIWFNMATALCVNFIVANMYKRHLSLIIVHLMSKHVNLTHELQYNSFIMTNMLILITIVRYNEIYCHLYAKFPVTINPI